MPEINEVQELKHEMRTAMQGIRHEYSNMVRAMIQIKGHIARMEKAMLPHGPQEFVPIKKPFWRRIFK